jgi:hypothetical protein
MKISVFYLSPHVYHSKMFLHHQRGEHVLKLQLEQEVGKVHRAHEELVQSSERRERLERAARSRLQGDVRRLQELNRALREQVELLSTQLLTGRPQNQSDLPDMAAENLRKELGKREIFIAQLITQSKNFKIYYILSFSLVSLMETVFTQSVCLSNYIWIIRTT